MKIIFRFLFHPDDFSNENISGIRIYYMGNVVIGNFVTHWFCHEIRIDMALFRVTSHLSIYVKVESNI